MINVLIKDRAQYERVNRPNELGINPFAAERLQSFGRDPQEFADRMRVKMAISTMASPKRMLPQSARKVVNELSIDYRDVTTREILQQAAMEAVDPEFIAEEVAPTQLVDDPQGTAFLRDHVEQRRQVDDTATGLSNPIEVRRNVSSVNYSCKLHAVQDYQDRHSASIAPRLVDVASMTELASRKAKLQHEIRVKTVLMTATSYAAANRRALAGGFNWNGGASAAPIADMQVMLGALFGPATHAVMSLEMWQAAQINDEIRAIVASRMNNQGMLSTMDFGLFFGIENVMIDEQRYSTTTATTLSRLYDSDKLAILSVSSDPRARTFLRNYMLRDGAAGYTVLTWFDEELGAKGSDRVKVSYANDLVVPDNTYGSILTGGRA